MARFLRNNLLIFSVLVFSASAVFAAEEFTITTYYPSPYGVYNELTTTGNAYLATTSGGKVGIGTIQPAAMLHLKYYGGAYDYNRGILINAYDNSAIQGLSLWFNNVNPGTAYIDSRNNSDSSIMHFRMKAAGTAVNAITILGSGNVGIGATPSTSYRLDVNGNFMTRTNADVLGKLDVRGRGDIGGDFDVLGEVNLAKTLHVARDLFVGHDLLVSGRLSKGAGTFLIDHPLDPKNKILRHSFVESPDMKNIYDGIIALDKNGEAIVKLPDYFEALNKDFRYQLTAIGLSTPNLYIKSKILDGYFVIGGGNPGQEVSWQVTGIRQDAYALKNPIIVEEEKGKGNDYHKGEYLYPDAQPVTQQPSAQDGEGE